MQFRPSQIGVTLFELLVALAVLGIVAAIAVPVYNDYVENARIQRIIVDLKGIEDRLERYYVSANGYPPLLTDVLPVVPSDPWGTPYQYTRIEGAGPGKGNFRKDKNLVPINTDFDLYSSGADGKSVGPLTAKSSRDDIVRANNGRYYGLADNY